eukprot:Clim_evm6s149 gene=Clim_evmTU6s149
MGLIDFVRKHVSGCQAEPEFQYARPLQNRPKEVQLNGLIDGETWHPSRRAVYFEKQRKHLCGVHALNNLLQHEAVTQRDLDHAADELIRVSQGVEPRVTCFGLSNPHRSRFGRGNYDVNVILYTLDKFGYVVQWHDARKEFHPSIDLENPRIIGFIVNIMATSVKWGFPSNRHWMAIRKLADGSYVNLDSFLLRPYIYETGDAVCRRLNEFGRDHSGQVLIVYAGGNEKEKNGLCGTTVVSAAEEKRLEAEGPIVESVKAVEGEYDGVSPRNTNSSVLGVTATGAETLVTHSSMTTTEDLDASSGVASLDEKCLERAHVAPIA